MHGFSFGFSMESIVSGRVVRSHSLPDSGAVWSQCEELSCFYWRMVWPVTVALDGSSDFVATEAGLSSYISGTGPGEGTVAAHTYDALRLSAVYVLEHNL